jgi:hypothetical protein
VPESALLHRLRTASLCTTDLLAGSARNNGFSDGLTGHCNSPGELTIFGATAGICHWPRPSHPLYRCALDFVERICDDIRDLNPRDIIDPNEHERIAQRIDPTRVLHFGANKDVEHKVHRHRTELFCTANSSGKFLRNY